MMPKSSFFNNLKMELRNMENFVFVIIAKEPETKAFHFKKH